ncbi:MAG: hypothetical protein HY240_06580 [Actinobacteria bacterium]|nr:hypothetical protein [Actinomycetota bacterium]
MSPSPVSLGADLELERTTDPIVAWRTWRLTGRRDGTNLRLRPVAGRAKPWAPERPTEAVCRLGRMHVAPNVDCTCGLHATREPDLLRRTKSPGVLGRVALWGRVVEHELGYRAQFGYPQRLALVCFLCFWQWGPLRCRADVVGYFGLGRMMPFCDDHLVAARRHGMAPAIELDARGVEQELRSTYVVDALAR